MDDGAARESFRCARPTLPMPPQSVSGEGGQWGGEQRPCRPNRPGFLNSAKRPDSLPKATTARQMGRRQRKSALRPKCRLSAGLFGPSGSLLTKRSSLQCPEASCPRPAPLLYGPRLPAEPPPTSASVAPSRGGWGWVRGAGS
eukprot:15480790-Alexandrium_andersonii.AAC.1